MPQYGSQRGLDYTERSVESKKQLGAVLAAAAKTLAEHASAHTLDRLKGYGCWSVADLREGTVWTVRTMLVSVRCGSGSINPNASPTLRALVEAIGKR